MKLISAMAENLTISPSNNVPNVAINDFPNELLFRVFLSLVDTEGARNTLGRVCYRWRQIVRTTSEFWTTIRLMQPVKVMKADPHLWAKQAGNSPKPLTVVWEINLLCHGNYYYDSYITAFRNFLKVAPYSRWRELRIGQASVTATAPTPRPLEERELLQTNKPPVDFSKASFENLESFELYKGSLETRDLVNALARTANKLSSVVISEYLGLSRFQMDLHTILSRVSTFQCIRLPPHANNSVGIPEKITRLTIANHYEVDCNFRNVTHLDVGLLRVNPNTILRFPNVKTLQLSSLDVAAGAETNVLRFPQLWTFKTGIRTSHLLRHISAPQLQSIQFTAHVQVDMASDSPINGSYGTLPCPSVQFQGGIVAECLPAALSWFPNVESLSVSLSLKLNDPNMSLLHLNSDFNIYQRSKDSDNTTGDNRHTKIFTCGPKLVSLHLRLPTFEDDYNLGLELAVSLLTARRKSSLKDVNLLWDDGREVTLTTDDI
jgi:hypothetical protein